MDRDNACPICGSHGFRVLCPWDRWQIAKCAGCGVIFTNPRPTEQELVKLYEDGSLLGAPDEGATPKPTPCPGWKEAEHRRLLERLRRFGVKGGRLLDVGCLWGFFLWNAEREGFQVSGVEPYRPAVRYLRETCGVTVHQGNLQSSSLAASSFHVVSLLDVIEHLPDPVAELREAFRILQPGGIALVLTPNAEGLPQRLIGMKRRLLGQPWSPIDEVPWHIWGFTQRTIARCMENAGFQVEAVELIEPSSKTTNRGVGDTAWKRVALRMVGEISAVLRMSDRMTAFGRKPGVQQA